MVQGTIADQASGFAMPVTIEVKGRKVHVKGSDGHWSESVHNVEIEAVMPTVFRFRFEGVDWTFRPENPLDAHFDLLDPWREAKSTRRRIHIRRAEPETWTPGAGLVVRREEAGGVQIESVVAPIDDGEFDQLPLIAEATGSTELLETGLSATITPTAEAAPAQVLTAAPPADLETRLPETEATQEFHFVKAVQPGLDPTTTSSDAAASTFDVLPPLDATPATDAGLPDFDTDTRPEAATPAARVEQAPEDISASRHARSDEAPADVAISEVEIAEVAGDSLEQDTPGDIHVFIDIDALPKPDARDPFGGDDLPVPAHRTLEETLRSDAWQTKPGDSASQTNIIERAGTAWTLAEAALRGIARVSRDLVRLAWRLAVWTWTVARSAVGHLGRATAPAIHRVGSVVFGIPTPVALPGQVDEGAGAEMCVDVHAWSIASHGMFRVARCVYCDEVRMDGEQSSSTEVPTFRRSGTVRTSEVNPTLPALSEA